MSSIPTLEEAADFVFPLLRRSKEVIEGAINSLKHPLIFSDVISIS